MDIGRDLRYAARILRRTPAFTIPAVASLALGIAVNTTMFSAVNAAVLRPLGLAGGGNLVRIGRSAPDERQFRSASREEFLYLREHASTLAGLAGHQVEPMVMRGPEGSQRVSAEIVAGDYFDALGAQPTLGRGFTAEEDRAAGQAPVAILSDRFWRRRFAGDPQVIGQTISLNAHTFTVVGVAPRGFTGTFPGVDIDVWTPALIIDDLMRGAGRGDVLSLFLIGRLNSGASLRAAEAELQMLARRMADEIPQQPSNRTFVLESARGVHPAFRIVQLFLGLLMGIVGVVLMVACANVASLMLARASARQGELAVRLALGASRRRIVRQLLVESLVLAVLGAVGGLAIALWAVRALNAFTLTTGPTGAPIFFDLRLDVRVLLFTAAATVLTALVFGLVPALHATRADLLSALKASQSLATRTRARLLGTLIVAQVALAFLLLSASGLMFRSLRNAGEMDVGFEPDRVFLASFDLQPLGYDRPRSEAFYDEVLRRARTLPTVEHAALADFVPLGARGASVSLTIAGREAPEGERRLTIPYNRVTEGYFATVRQPLIRGRDFTIRDTRGAPLVAIVTEAMAHRFWPGEDAIGKRVRIEGEPAEREVVAIARDARFASFGDDIGPFIFLPVRQVYGPHATLHVRVTTDSSSTLADIRRLVRDIDQNVALSNGQTMRGAMAFRLIPLRVAHTVFSIAGLIGLLLGAGGLYGLVCYTLERRLKEIGIRIALGASRRQVLRLITGGAVRLTVMGIFVGVAIAAGAMRLFSALLYGIGVVDPLTFGVIGTLLLAITAGAGYAAARKGLDVDPVVLLRE